MYVTIINEKSKGHGFEKDQSRVYVRVCRVREEGKLCISKNEKKMNF